MVFEQIVVELVNRFLGDFVENLDKSQLSIGLWGGMSFGMSVGLFYNMKALRYWIRYSIYLT